MTRLIAHHRPVGHENFKQFKGGALVKHEFDPLGRNGALNRSQSTHRALTHLHEAPIGLLVSINNGTRQRAI